MYINTTKAMYEKPTASIIFQGQKVTWRWGRDWSYKATAKELLGHWKKQGRIFSLEPLEKTRPYWHLDFELEASRIPELWESKFLLFKETQFMVIFYGSSTNLVHTLIAHKTNPLRIKCESLKSLGSPHEVSLCTEPA